MFNDRYAAINPQSLESTKCGDYKKDSDRLSRFFIRSRRRQLVGRALATLGGVQLEGKRDAMS